MDRPPPAPAEPVDLTRETVARHVGDLPFSVRKALEFAALIRIGTLVVTLPDGRSFRFRGERASPEAHLIVRDLAFARRFAGGGDIGIAEAYLRGEWETPNLTRFLELFCVNHELIALMLQGKPIIRAWQRFRHWLNRNSRAGSRRNIHVHYDLGNRFYEQWLDGTMTYSAALFDESHAVHHLTADELAKGQIRKYGALAEKTMIRPHHHVLEIGCGWGGFAEYAAKTIGCKVTGLTISQAQYDYARRRMFEQGLNDKVEIRFQDYRDERGLYDRIASIEMFEAVGERYWPVYFEQLAARLKPGGVAGLQVITIQDRFFETYRREMDFIRRYIFPGGMLPSPDIMKGLGERFGLALHHERVFGLDYAVTLAEWRSRFRAAWPNLVPLGFDERFRRMWEYYLAYCEAGFRSGNIDVRHLVYAKQA